MRVPRASFSVRMLNDAEARSLAATARGRQALGTFMLLCLAGRVQLMEGRASRVGTTDALSLDMPVASVAVCCGVSKRDILRDIQTLNACAIENGGKPWVTQDGDRISIRSFFKFNTKEGWGGPRDTSPKGAKMVGNADQLGDQLGPQPETNLKPSCAASGSGSGSGSGDKNPLTPLEQIFDSLDSELSPSSPLAPIPDGCPADPWQQFEWLWEQFPEELRTSRARCVGYWRNGMTDEARRTALVKVREYVSVYQSASDRTYFPAIRGWLESGEYDTPVAAWRRRGEGKAKGRDADESTPHIGSLNT